MNQQIQFSGSCGIPSGIKAVATNLTGIPQTGRCDFAFPPGDLAVSATTLFSVQSNVRALSATLGLSRAGEGTLWAIASCPSGGASHLVVDVTGYFEE